MMKDTTCPYCRKAHCALNLARLKQAGTLTLESPTVGGLSAEQLHLAGKLEEVLYERTSRGSWRDMAAPLALEDDPILDTSLAITSEEPLETAGGLLSPSVDHWIGLEDQESRFANGLVRPDAVADESIEQLRALFLQKPSKPVALTQEQLKQLGFLPDHEPVSISPDRIAVGNMIIPDF